MSVGPAAHASSVTAVVCTRDRGPAVIRTLQSILLNTYPAFDVVVVDQSDDERTREALSPFRARGDVRYVRTASRGLAAGRNLGIRAAFLARRIHAKHEVEGVGGCMALRRDVWSTLNGFDEMLGLGAPFPAGEEGDLAIRA